MDKRDILNKIREHYHLEKNIDFAAFFGISDQTAFMRQKKGFIDYEEVYRRCPDISPDWLLSGGEGPMLRSERGEMPYKAYQPAPEKENDKALEMALEALAKEQESTKVLHDSLVKAQEQISALIDLVAKR